MPKGTDLTSARVGLVVHTAVVLLVALGSGMAEGFLPASSSVWTAYYDPVTHHYSLQPHLDPVNGGTSLTLEMFVHYLIDSRNE